MIKWYQEASAIHQVAFDALEDMDVLGLSAWPWVVEETHRATLQNAGFSSWDTPHLRCRVTQYASRRQCNPDGQPQRGGDYRPANLHKDTSTVIRGSSLTGPPFLCAGPCQEKDALASLLAQRSIGKCSSLMQPLDEALDGNVQQENAGTS